MIKKDAGRAASFLVYLRYMETQQTNHEVAVFGGGCFWCTEAVFTMLKGVESVTPGYAGGSVDNPTYEQVSSGTTGHVEVTRVVFDPNRIGYRTLLLIFFASHDPTILNRQGNDVGTQYRSVVFYTTPNQEQIAHDFIDKLNKTSIQGAPIVTSVEPLEAFFEAEDYHKNYYSTHSDAPYCQLVINPKLDKVKKKFADLLKKG